MIEIELGKNDTALVQGQLERYCSPLVQFQQNTPRLRLKVFEIASGYFAQNPPDN